MLDPHSRDLTPLDSADTVVPVLVGFAAGLVISLVVAFLFALAAR